MPSGQTLGQPKSGENLSQAKEKQAEAVLSPEMVMAEFDRQVGTIHCTAQQRTIDVLFAQTVTTLSGQILAHNQAELKSNFGPHSLAQDGSKSMGARATQKFNTSQGVQIPSSVPHQKHVFTKKSINYSNIIVFCETILLTQDLS